jgi:hypothetical protein
MSEHEKPVRGCTIALHRVSSSGGSHKGHVGGSRWEAMAGMGVPHPESRPRNTASGYIIFRL